MKLRGSVAAAWLLAVVGAALAAEVGEVLAAPAKGQRAASRASVPEWIARQRGWDAARRDRQTARWGGTLDQIVATSSRAASAESNYVAALETWAMGESLTASVSTLPMGALHGVLRRGAFDLVERNRLDAAARILESPLRGDRSVLPLRARLTGLRISPDSGLALLCWPPDRRPFGARTIRWDTLGRARVDGADATLLVAAELADSIGQPRVRRAALWRLLHEPRPAVKSVARNRLARSLVALGEPRLAGQILAEAHGIGDDERILLANLRADLAAALGDTVRGAKEMIDAAREPNVSTAARYAISKRAAEWLRGSRVDSLDESRWIDLVRTLGDVGEGETALSLVKRRHVAPPDQAAALARDETEASILARLKRNDAAASAYAKLLGREDLRAPDRAKYALGLARARRGLGEFEAMDRAFLLAVSLDSTGAGAGVAAWERAREWEDRRTPAEAIAIFSWAKRYVRESPTAQALMAHGVIACIRAARPDSGLQFINDAYGSPAQYWRARIDFAKGDSAAARARLKQVASGESWTYESVRAREVLASPGAGASVSGSTASTIAGGTDRPAAAASGAGTLEGRGVPLPARMLGAVGATELMMDALRDCAQSDEAVTARACADGLEERGVFRAGRAGVLPRERLEYPPAYPISVLAAAERESLSASLLWAIMRQESAYQRAARSKAGALGLLQLLPSTAAKLNGGPVPEAALTDVDPNVRLGAKYVRWLLTEFGDSRAALAAYNAGEEAVRRWLKDHPTVDDIWVELIPYRETRDYVKQVYSIWRRYEALYGIPAADRR